MPYPRVERVTGIYAPTGSSTANLAFLAPVLQGTGQTHNAKRLIGFTCRVVTASNGTGTVSIGTTAGGVAVIMTTANVGSGTTGVKTTAGGTSNINGILATPGASANYITATYVIGTDTVTPVIRWTAILIHNETWLDLAASSATDVVD